MRQEEHKVVADTENPEQSVARLLKLSGERTLPTEEAAARAHAAALDVWQASIDEGRSRNRWQVTLRLAAVIVVVIAGAIVWSSFSGAQRDARIAAHSLIVNGDTELLRANGEVSPFAAGDAVQVRSQLISREGTMSLALGDSLSLRVNRHTRIRFDAENRVTLLAGTIYIDSGGLSAHSDLRITTPAGEVRHEGTQYQVSVDAGETRIQVREGRVRLTSDAANASAHISAGEALDVDVAGKTIRRAIPAFGPDWEWASSLAVALDIDNRPLSEFLAWMAREHGWQLRYATPVVEREAQVIRLHGAVQQGTAEQTLRRVALMTGLAMHVDEGILVIGSRGADAR